jgi:vacuolar protein sorting-associated protein 35
MSKTGKDDPKLQQQDELKVLADAKNVVNTQAFHMKRALDGNKLMEALKHASLMLGELRTSLLSPRNYYALYIIAADHLRHLEMYIADEKHGKSLNELYEIVQYAGNILPRLYLLITVGSTYIKSKKAPAKDVLKDLVEMCRGVQHHTRGLFLRTFLSEMVKDKLPEEGSEYNGWGGNVGDAVDFILTNFIEMNKLWVRMQHQIVGREKEKREKERKDLSTLVGKNLQRLSQVEVDIETYKRDVLPRILEQIVQCGDRIAQQYLMEIVIQAFPDEFHLQTLGPLLTTCGQLNSEVDLRPIITSLIDRLAMHILNQSDRALKYTPGPTDIYHVLYNHVTGVFTERGHVHVSNILAIMSSLARFALRTYNDQPQYVDEVLLYCHQAMEKADKTELEEDRTIDELMELLHIPVDMYRNILHVLRLENYGKLFAPLDFNNRKTMSLDIIENILEHETTLPDAENVAKLLELLNPLLIDAAEPNTAYEASPKFVEDLNLLSRVLHMFQAASIEDGFGILIAIKKKYDEGGMKRQRHTLIPLTFKALRLIQDIRKQQASDAEWEKKVRRVTKFVHECIGAFKKTSSLQTTAQVGQRSVQLTSLGLYVQAAIEADQCKLNEFAYDFMTQAYTVYEDDIAESREQFDSIRLIIGALQAMKNFDDESYDTLITKTAQHSSRLLKKPDQCIAVAMCSHLFFSSDSEKSYKDSKRVLECLKKSMKVADSCMDTSVNIQLFVEILNEYLYYFETNPEVDGGKYLNGLIQLINQHLPNVTGGDDVPVKVFYRNVLNHVRNKQAVDERYKAIEL